MPIFVNDNGTLRESVGLYVNDNGTLRNVNAIYVNDNGTLRTIHVSRTTLPSSDSFSGFNTSGSAGASLLFSSGDGNWSATENGLEGGSGWADDGGTWLQFGAAGDYEVRLSKLSGSDPDSGTLATWIDLSVGELWTWTISGSSSKSFTGTLEIRNAATQTVHSEMSVSVTLTFLGG